jgi:hypothetical protein
MPPGDERTEAINKAMVFRNAEHSRSSLRRAAHRLYERLLSSQQDHMGTEMLVPDRRLSQAAPRERRYHDGT